MFTFTTRTSQTQASASFVTELDQSESSDAGTNDPAYDSSSNSYTEQGRTTSHVDTSGNTFVTQTGLGNNGFLTSADGAGIAQAANGGRTSSYFASLYTNGDVIVSSYDYATSSGTSQYNGFAATETVQHTESVSVIRVAQSSNQPQTFTTGTTTTVTQTLVSVSATSARPTTEAYTNTAGDPSARTTTTGLTTSSLSETTMQSVVFGTEEQLVPFYVVSGSTTSNVTSNVTTADAGTQDVTAGQTNTVVSATFSNFPTFASATVVEPRNNIVWSVTTTTEDVCHVSQIAESYTQRTTIVPTYTSQQMATRLLQSSVQYSHEVSEASATISAAVGFGENDTTAETIARMLKTGSPPYKLPANSLTIAKTTGETAEEQVAITTYTTAVTADGTSKQFAVATHTVFESVSSSITVESVWRKMGTVSAQSNVIYRSTAFVANAGQYSSRNEIKEGQTIEPLHFKDASQVAPNAMPQMAGRSHAQQFADPANTAKGTNVSAQGRTIEFFESSKTASVAKRVDIVRPGSLATEGTTYSFGGSVSVTEGTSTTVVPWVVMGEERTDYSTISHKVIANAASVKNAQTLPNISVFAACTSSPVAAPTIFIPPGFYATSNNSTSGTLYLSAGITSENQDFAAYNTFAPAFAGVGETGSPYFTVAGDYHKIPASSL
jgi:hypothetical protein